MRCTATRSANGDYIVTFLPPGDYTVTFELAGFATVKETVRVSGTPSIPMNVTMALSTVTESVTVVAETAGEFNQTAQVATSYKSSRTSLEGGSVFRFCRYEPGNKGRWHRKDSVDYAICLSGEMWMELDEGKVHLKPGDVVVQRGTNHNWVNRGTEPCVMAFVLIATEGGKSTGWQEHTR